MEVIGLYFAVFFCTTGKKVGVQYFFKNFAGCSSRLEKYFFAVAEFS